MENNRLHLDDFEIIIFKPLQYRCLSKYFKKYGTGRNSHLLYVDLLTSQTIILFKHYYPISFLWH